MDRKDVEASLKKISAEIQTVSDQELNTMGQETSMMVQVLKMTMGADNTMYQDAKKLLDILKNEYDRRHGTEPRTETKEQVVVNQKAPRTVSELLALGDGDVEGVEIVPKPSAQKIKVPDTFCELMALG